MNYFKQMHKIKLFVQSLMTYHSADVFNPWADFDPDYDVAYARSIRKAQLERYLSRRLDTPGFCWWQRPAVIRADVSRASP